MIRPGVIFAVMVAAWCVAGCSSARSAASDVRTEIQKTEAAVRMVNDSSTVTKTTEETKIAGMSAHMQADSIKICTDSIRRTVTIYQPRRSTHTTTRTDFAGTVTAETGRSETETTTADTSLTEAAHTESTESTGESSRGFLWLVWLSLAAVMAVGAFIGWKIPEIVARFRARSRDL